MPEAYNTKTRQRSRKRPILGRRIVRRYVLPYLVIGMFLLVWQVGVVAFKIEAFVLPSPTSVFYSMWMWREPILLAAWQTFVTTIVGFGVAIAVGLIGGAVIGSSSLLYDVLYPSLIGFNSLPKVAVVPILVIWFGIGSPPAIITAFLISFFPILVNVATGMATVEPELRDVLLALGAKRWQVITKVGLPRAMPYFFASLKVAVSVAFVGSITAETVASDKGIGQLMLLASSRFEVSLAFAGLLVTGAMGIGLYAVFALIEGRTTGWATRGMANGGFLG